MPYTPAVSAAAPVGPGHSARAIANGVSARRQRLARPSHRGASWCQVVGPWRKRSRQVVDTAPVQSTPREAGARRGGGGGGGEGGAGGGGSGRPRGSDGGGGGGAGRRAGGRGEGGRRGGGWGGGGGGRRGASIARGRRR